MANSFIYLEFAELLNGYLSSQDRSGRWLAQRLKVSPSTISRWCSGETRPNTPETMVRIADILAVYDEDERGRFIASAGYAYIPGAGHHSPNEDDKEDAEQEEVPANDPNNLDVIPPKQIPEYPDFVGRKEELEHYQNMLDEEGMAVIEGLVGVGKTALAAKLAHQNSESRKIFWHECFPLEGADAIIWALANFLAWHKQPALLELLNKQLANGQLPPMNNVISFLFRELSRGQYLLCFDNVHYFVTDLEQERLGSQLLQSAQNGQIELLLTSQVHLQFIDNDDLEPLSGLKFDDFCEILSLRNINLDESLVSELYERTEGNAHLVSMAIDALANESNPADMVNRLVKSRGIRRFLLREIHKGLEATEKDVMEGLSVLLGYPGTADEVARILEVTDDIPETLMVLTNRYLLREMLTGDLFTYQQHAIIRAFYYDLLTDDKRHALHCRAGEYYEDQDPLRGATHFLYAIDYRRAAELVTIDVRSNLIRGRMKELLYILEKLGGLEQSELELVLNAEVKLATGQVYGYQQRTDEAVSILESAYELLESVEAGNSIYTLRAQICRDVAYLLRATKPEEALNWVQRVVGHWEEKISSLQLADLHIQRGHAFLRTGNNSLASESFEYAWTLLPKESHFLQIHALIGLGNASFYQQNLDQSAGYFEQALPIADELDDKFNRLALTINLANINQETGNWSESHQLYDSADALADEVGHIDYAMLINFNSGVLYLHEGEHKDAERRLAAALIVSQAGERHEITIKILSYLAELQLERASVKAAIRYLEQANELLQHENTWNAQPFLNYVWGQVYLTLDEYTKAKENANRAIELADKFGMDKEKGMNLRLLGQVQTAQKNFDEAEANFKRSIELLMDNPFERNLTESLRQ